MSDDFNPFDAVRHIANEGPAGRNAVTTLNVIAEIFRAADAGILDQLALASKEMRRAPHNHALTGTAADLARIKKTNRNDLDVVEAVDRTLAAVLETGQRIGDPKLTAAIQNAFDSTLKERISVAWSCMSPPPLYEPAPDPRPGSDKKGYSQEHHRGEPVAKNVITNPFNVLSAGC